MHIKLPNLMTTLDIKLIVPDYFSNDGGRALYDKMTECMNEKSVIELKFNDDMNLCSSFLNSSIGEFIENYGVDCFKSKFRFRGNKNQFKRISYYIKKHSEVYA